MSSQSLISWVFEGPELWFWGGGMQKAPPPGPKSSTHPVPKIAPGKPSSPWGPLGAPVPVAWEKGGLPQNPPKWKWGGLG